LIHFFSAVEKAGLSRYVGRISTRLSKPHSRAPITAYLLKAKVLADVDSNSASFTDDIKE